MYTARINGLFADVAGGYYWDLPSRGITEVSHELLVAFIRSHFGTAKIPKAWSDEGTKRVASGLLKTLVDFGYLAQGRGIIRPITPPNLLAETACFIAYEARERGVSDSSIIDEPAFFAVRFRSIRSPRGTQASVREGASDCSVIRRFDEIFLQSFHHGGLYRCHLPDELFDELRVRLKTSDRFNSMGGEPVYYLVFPAERMLEMKRSMKVLLSRLTLDGWIPKVLSLAEEVNNIFRSDSDREIILEAERAYLDEGDFTSINESLRSILLGTGTDKITKRILLELEELKTKPGSILVVCGRGSASSVCADRSRGAASAGTLPCAGRHFLSRR